MPIYRMVESPSQHISSEVQKQQYHQDTVHNDNGISKKGSQTFKTMTDLWATTLIESSFTEVCVTRENHNCKVNLTDPEGNDEDISDTEPKTKSIEKKYH